MQSGNSFRERIKEGGIGRRISFSGLVLLCICFFLPQVRSCDDDIVPARYTFTLDAGPLFIVTWGVPFIFAFLGLIFYVLRWRTESAATRRLATRLLCGTCLVLLLYGIILLGTLLMRGAEARWWLLAALVLVEGVAAVLILSFAWPRAKTPLILGLCGLATLGYCFVFIVPESSPPPPTLRDLLRSPALVFMPTFSPDVPLYGVFISASASVLIAVGGAWEAVTAIQAARAARASLAEGQPAA